MRTLEEKAALLRRIGARAGERQAVSYNEEAGGYEKHVETIRELLVQNQRVQMREEGKGRSLSGRRLRLGVRRLSLWCRLGWSRYPGCRLVGLGVRACRECLRLQPD